MSLAGSRLITATLRPNVSRNCAIAAQYVVLPDPGGPITTWPNDMIQFVVSFPVIAEKTFLKSITFIGVENMWLLTV